MNSQLQNFEMAQYVKLNEDLLDDETNPQLLDLMKAITNQLKQIMLQFKAIAKAKGMRFLIPDRKNKGDTSDARHTATSNQSKESHAF